MSDDRRPYSADEKDPFSYIDDEESSERPVEDEMLAAEDYRGADRHGTTPAEERRRVPLEEYLDEEEADRPEEAVTDEWSEGPDPRADALADSYDGFAEEPTSGAMHVTEDDRERAAEIREEDEAGPPERPGREPGGDQEPEPGPDDWRA